MKRISVFVSLALVLGLVIGCPNDTPEPVPVPEKVSSPVFSLADGSTVEDGMKLTLASATNGASVYYTTGTSEFSKDAWILYNNPIEINFGSESSVIYKAIALKDGMTDSAVANATYTKMGTVAVPTVMYNNSVLAENSAIDFSIRLELRSGTAYATVHYKFSDQIDFSEIENGATVIIPKGSTSITVKATKHGLADSSEFTVNFRKATVQTPVISVGAVIEKRGSGGVGVSVGADGTPFIVSQEVAIQCATSDATIYYTDGLSDFSVATWAEYTTGSTIIATGTIRAVAVKAGYENSKETSKELSIMPMVPVKGGSFDRWQGFIKVDSFMLGTYEVTQGQWEAVMGEIWPGNDPATTTYGSSEMHPVFFISWYDAITFCNKLSIMEGLDPVYYVEGIDFNVITVEKIPSDVNDDWDAVSVNKEATGYRLPTEAEWEYAAGGGETNRTIYAAPITVDSNYDGIDDVSKIDLRDYAWYNESTDLRESEEVGTKKANDLGLYDMSGNLQEWCWDWYGNYNPNETDNPDGPDIGEWRILRGGFWNDYYQKLKVGDRRDYIPSDRLSVMFGFRVARNVN